MEVTIEKPIVVELIDAEQTGIEVEATAIGFSANPPMRCYVKSTYGTGHILPKTGEEEEIAVIEGTTVTKVSAVLVADGNCAYVERSDLEDDR